MSVSEGQGGSFKFSHLLFPITVVTFLWEVFFSFVEGPRWVLIIVPLVQVVCMMMATSHGRNLCIWCINRVPDDAPVRANGNRKWSLWMQHRVFGSWLFVGPFIVFSLFIIPWLRRLIWETDTGLPGRWLYLPGSFLVVIMVFCWITHHRLGPWCPYCKGWGEGGPREHSPTPDPSMLKKV